MKTISIDIGNGYIKAINEDGEKIHFPTVVTKSKDKNILGLSQNDYNIDVDGIGFFVGDLAMCKGGVRQWDLEKTINADTSVYVALCSHLLNQEDAPEINLCLGLPYSYYVDMGQGEGR